VSFFVIDASVAVKWFLPPAGEPLVKEAWRFLALYTEGRARLAVPDLFWAECANVFWRAARQGRLTFETAEEALRALMGLGLPTRPSRELLQQAFTMAHTFHRALYDCLYVVLAVRSSAELLTADEKLANALAAYFPVKWLGSI
jgi:predicted nucleic acid-binding protein